MKKLLTLTLTLALLLCAGALLTSCEKAPVEEPEESSSVNSEVEMPSEPSESLPSESLPSESVSSEPSKPSSSDPAESSSAAEPTRHTHRYQFTVTVEECEKGGILSGVCADCGALFYPGALTLETVPHRYTVVKAVTGESILLECAICGKTVDRYAELELSAFDSDETHFRYTEESDGSLTVTAYTGNAECVKFPAQIGGKPVKTLDLQDMTWEIETDEHGNGIVQFGGNIRKVLLSEGIERIADRCFLKWLPLEEVYLPSSLREIGTAAFAKTSIQNLYLPEGLQKLGTSFISHSSVQFISIPASLTEIDESAPLLTQVALTNGFYVAEGNPAFYSENGSLYRADGSLLMEAPDYPVSYARVEPPIE